MITPARLRSLWQSILSRLTQLNRRRVALSAERPLMHLVKMAELVEDINRAIDAPPPPEPKATPVLRGTTDDFEGFVSEGTTLMRHTTPSGVTTVRNIPTSMLTLKVRARFYDLYTSLEEADATRVESRA